MTINRIGMLVCALFVLAASSASAAKPWQWGGHVDFCWHFNPWKKKFYLGPCPEDDGGGGCDPNLRALVVLLENGGFPAAMPVDATITVKTCDVSGWQCVYWWNWSYKTFSVTDYLSDMINGGSDWGLEAIGAAMVWASLPFTQYDEVIILEDDDFDPDTALDELEGLACDYVVDIHVLSHGNVGCFGPSCEFTDDFIEDVGTIDDFFLGTVYQQNSFGASLNDDWMDAGAVAVAGVPSINYMPASYGDFIAEWVDGASFEDAIETAFDDWADTYSNLYKFVDLYLGNTERSVPLISLTGSLGVNDELNASTHVIDGDAGALITEL